MRSYMPPGDGVLKQAQTSRGPGEPRSGLIDLFPTCPRRSHSRPSIERLAPFDRHIDLIDLEGLILHD